MIAVANSIKEVIEIRKFASNMEAVLSIDYDKTRFPGKYITEEEAKKHGLTIQEKDEHEDL